MNETVAFVAITAFLLAVFTISLVLAIRGNPYARYFLWGWAGLMLLATPFTFQPNAIPTLVAGVIAFCFLYVVLVSNQRSHRQLEESHEETRRVLAESNRRIDEERRNISRRLHDQVNPNLLVCKNELKRLETYLKHDTNALQILSSAATLLTEAYAQTRDIIKNTRIEIIDSVGFTAALESLIAHYTNFFDKPAIHLEHNLEKRPKMSEEVAVTVYKIIREAIFNAIKHAGAQEVHVKVIHNPSRGTFTAEIIDDGIGMKPKAQGGHVLGIGLIDMRERARAIGGSLKIGPANPSNPKRPGTRVIVSFSGQGS